MTKFVRTILFIVCVVQFFLALATFMQLPFVLDLWPFPETTPLTFIFVSSIFAAAAASTLWALVTQNYATLAGIGLDYLTIMLPVSVLLFQLAASTGEARNTLYAILFVFGGLFGLALFLWSLRFPLDRTIPMPALVRASFIIFIIALLLVSLRLIFKVPNTIPWSITPQLSVVVGWMFLGAAAYFAYALLRPSWVNAAGQLVGFLAYDLVLILPFLTRLPTVAPHFRLGLIVYTLVVSYSGLLAIYFLFIHKPTRLFRSSS